MSTEHAVADVIQQSKEAQERLRNTPVNAASTRGIVKVVLNGVGDAIEMRIKPGATQQYAHDSMGAHATSALQAGDRAVEALATHAFGSISVGGDTVDGSRRNRPSAASTVAECFSGSPESNRVVRSRK